MDGSNLDAVIRSIGKLGIELIVVYVIFIVYCVLTIGHHFVWTKNDIVFLIIANRTKNVTDVPDKENQAESVTFSQSMEKDQIKEKSQALIMEIVKSSNGSLCSLDEALTKLMYVDKKQRRRMPWNCELTFGTKLAIKIAAYIYVSFIYHCCWCYMN